MGNYKKINKDSLTYSYGASATNAVMQCLSMLSNEPQLVRETKEQRVHTMLHGNGAKKVCKPNQDNNIARFDHLNQIFM